MRLVTTAVLCLGMIYPTIGQAEDKVVEVHQIIDLAAHSKEEMFRFTPKVTRVALGSTVRFKGSTGRHSVTLIKKMAPKGVRGFDIQGKPQVDMVFDIPGIYGLRCRVHGRHGMVMLLAVGDDWSNLDAAQAHLVKLAEAERAVFEKLFEQLDTVSSGN